MSRLRVAILPACAVVALTLVACSGSPVAPSEMTASPGSSSTDAKPGLPAGTYALNFMDHQHNIIASMPVETDELLLNAHILDANGQPAQNGTATFEYCAYRGFPPNDINRVDKAPASACEDPSLARWKSFISIGVFNGDAFAGWGVVHIPRKIGFRLRYAQSRTIAPGTTVPADFEWTAQ